MEKSKKCELGREKQEKYGKSEERKKHLENNVQERVSLKCAKNIEIRLQEIRRGRDMPSNVEHATEKAFLLIAQQLLESRKPDVAFRLGCLNNSQVGDARLLAHLAQGWLLFDTIEKCRYLWAGHAWQKDRGGDSFRLIIDLLIPCYEEMIAELKVQMEDEFITKEQLGALKKTLSLVESRVRNLGMFGWITSIASHVDIQPQLCILSEQWDLQRWLLPCPNGVIDLRTGLLSDGRPEDHMRTACPTSWYGLEATAPRFMRFLHEIFEDRPLAEREELIAFLQRLLGYALSAQVNEHVFIILYGEEGRNGKDTLLHVISFVLGTLATMVSKDVLLDASKGKAGGSASPHLRDLQGRRVAIVSESESGAKFHTSQVKELTGGSEIVSRGLFEKEMTRFKPTHTLFLLTNHKPRADAHDRAFWERLVLFTFNMRFVDQPEGPNERRKDRQLWGELEREAPGILAWLVRGCLEWQRLGLAIPDCVRKEVESYREEEDTVQTFLDERCTIRDGLHVKSRTLYQTYSDWCHDSNLRPFSSTRFGFLLRSKGLEKVHVTSGNVYEGVGLLDMTDY